MQNLILSQAAHKITIDALIRSNRKSVSLTVTKEAKLIVKAPIALSLFRINEIIYGKRAWILEKQALFKSIPPKKIRKFTTGERFLFLGKTYVLSTDNEKQFQIMDSRLIIPESFLDKARQYITDWYKKQALKIISSRLTLLSRQTGIKYSSLKITNAAKRWGSCGAEGKINFSWRLVMCPEDAIDYVIIHELAHIEIRNHSAAFWKKVENLMPDYKAREDWFKRNSGLIDF